MTYQVLPDPTGISCTVVASPKAARSHRITTTYIADPSRDAVLMRVRFPGAGRRPAVCAARSSSPICSVDPGTVPKVIDTIAPSGVDQAT